MRIQVYKTKRGAIRYAREIAQKFADVHVTVVTHGFDWAVECKTPRGVALAGTRPARYGVVVGYADILAGNFRIPNGEAL